MLIKHTNLPISLGVVWVMCFDVLVSSDKGACPAKWSQFGCSCYFFSSTSQTVTWTQAREACRGKSGSELAIITSKDENDFIGNHSSGYERWVGLRQKANSSFQWLDKETTLNYQVWETAPITKAKTECVATRPTKRWIWTAENCSKKHRYICEQPVSAGNTFCPNKWKKLRKSCYFLSKASANFNDAQVRCKSLNGSLAEITTNEENQFVTFKLLTDKRNEVVLFGLQRKINSTKFTYSTSEPDYSAIGIEKPKIVPSAGCAVMSIGNESAVWLRTSCDNNKTFICEMEARRDFEITKPSVNETSATISWKLKSMCNKLSTKFHYELTVKNGSTTICKKEIKNSSPILCGDLRPAKDYKIIITEQSPGRFPKRMWSRSFKTSEITNPLRVMTNLSSSSIKADMNEKAILLCTVHGEPPIKFYWTKDKKPLKSFGEVNGQYPSSLLVVNLEHRDSYGEYVCMIQDRFSNITHEILVDDRSTDNRGEQLVIAVVFLCIFLLLSFAIVGWLAHQLWKKKISSEKDLDATRGQESVNENTANPSENANTVKAEKPKDAETEMVSYTSLRRKDNETEEDYYCHLNENLYENTKDV